MCVCLAHACSAGCWTRVSQQHTYKSGPAWEGKPGTAHCAIAHILTSNALPNDTQKTEAAALPARQLLLNR
jgi:hypothetical protein